MLLVKQEDCLQHVLINSNDLHPNVELSFELTDREKGQINVPLVEFSDVFVTIEGPIGQTNMVKHVIHTKGLPIRQPPRCLLDASQNP